VRLSEFEGVPVLLVHLNLHQNLESVLGEMASGIIYPMEGVLTIKFI
jgi:hypothetical protein